MQKIIFKRHAPTPDKGSTVMRIRPAAFLAVEYLAKETGESTINIASRLILEAANWVEIED